jgi:hypothetical protein
VSEVVTDRWSFYERSESPPLVAWWEVMSPGGLLVEKRWTIGSSKQADLWVPGRDVEPFHAEIILSRGYDPHQLNRFAIRPEGDGLWVLARHPTFVFLGAVKVGLVDREAYPITNEPLLLGPHQVGLYGWREKLR